MTSQEIQEKFIKFFEERGHKVLPPSSLVPDTVDPSVLFTTAGMQQFKGWFSGEEKARYPRVVTVQPCLRTSDIDEVGDKTHLTFFEMLGNFSFNNYFKKEAIELAWEFLTDEKWLGIDRLRLKATYFAGDKKKGLASDKESLKYLEALKEKDLKEIEAQNYSENFWTLGTEGSPGGPTVEFYVDRVEVWNLVFNEFKLEKGKWNELEQKGVDTGMGLERLAMVMQGKTDVFETDIYQPIIKSLDKVIASPAKRGEAISDVNEETASSSRKAGLLAVTRVLADHIRASEALIKEGIVPSNKGQGYVLRRLLRRIVLYSEKPRSLIEDRVAIDEFDKFQKTINQGKKKIEKLETLDGRAAFDLYQTYGFPFELSEEYANSKGIKIEKADFENELKRHQEISKTGAEKKFSGANQEKIARLHTATHILHETLRRVLGDHVEQRGQDINSERLRFDFSHPDKMTPEQTREVEDKVNEVISQNLPVKCEEVTVEEAKKQGARALFLDKYKGKVTMYSVGDPSAGSGQVYSKELCKGPHVKNTSEIGHFKILKEESSSAGVRRIKVEVY